MLSCKDISHLASDHIDNKLPFLTKMKIKMHLFMCHHCRAFIKQLRTTIKTIKHIKPTPAKQSVIDLQVQTLLKTRQQIKPDNIDR